jgi:hypothetical protein
LKKRRRRRRRDPRLLLLLLLLVLGLGLGGFRKLVFAYDSNHIGAGRSSSEVLVGRGVLDDELIAGGRGDVA